jgi:23S rRNA (cytosine1962-C5)-methyltransferase
MESKSDAPSGKPDESCGVTGENWPEPVQSAYELLDFGDGRKLERFAGNLLDRPSPASKGQPKKRRSEWKSARWSYRGPPDSSWSDTEFPENWLFRWKNIVMELRLSPFGHVGLFPEQIANWRWLESIGAESGRERPTLKGLNLFGYTGGSTLAMATAGVDVTHVDASRPTVQWARRNAELSSLVSTPIRWIVDDVREFVKREIRRNALYDIILMDPPAYGHGRDGEGWELNRDLDGLVADCMSLMSSTPKGFLLTGHSPIPSIEKGPISGSSWDRIRARFSQLSKHRVSLADSNRRKLDFGYAYRFWN